MCLLNETERSYYNLTSTYFRVGANPGHSYGGAAIKGKALPSFTLLYIVCLPLRRSFLAFRNLKFPEDCVLNEHVPGWIPFIFAAVSTLSLGLEISNESRECKGLAGTQAAWLAGRPLGVSRGSARQECRLPECQAGFRSED